MRHCVVCLVVGKLRQGLEAAGVCRANQFGCEIDWANSKESATAYGRKLQEEFGRLATSVNISDISRCCTEVSWQEPTH